VTQQSKVLHKSQSQMQRATKISTKTVLSFCNDFCYSLFMFLVRHEM